MHSVYELCSKNTSLNPSDIQQLQMVADQLQLIADLTSADIFIDCINKDGKSAIVVAEAKPSHGRVSLYSGSVCGMPVNRENEPAVFHALESGHPVQDLKAITQESIAVKQDVTPIKSPDGRIIGALIRERDITSSLIQEKKYQELARRQKSPDEMGYAPENNISKTILREMHHRVKNSLQLVASIMNLQARQANAPEIRRVFEENMVRILTIAATHDIISFDGGMERVSLRGLFERLVNNLTQITAGNRSVNIVVDGCDVQVSADTASAIALVTNELISNSLEHAFEPGEAGIISVSIHSGSLYCAVWVVDDGHGFDVSRKSTDSLGLRLASMTVQDKLGGELFVSSSSKGTQVSFTFKSDL